MQTTTHHLSAYSEVTGRREFTLRAATHLDAVLYLSRRGFDEIRTVVPEQPERRIRCVYTIEHVQPSGRRVEQKRSQNEHDFSIPVYDPTDMHAARCSRCGIVR